VVPDAGCWESRGRNRRGGRYRSRLGAVHCAVELLDDEWDGFADVDPVQAKAARNAMVRELEGSDVPVTAAHFPNLRFGRVLPGERTRRFEFL
jgi:hypothetical protein